MKYFNLIVLITISLASIESYVIVTDVDDTNYEIAEKIVQEEFDEYGNRVFRTVYKVKDPMETLSDKFEIFRNRFIEDQKNIFNQARDAIEEYRNTHDYEVNSYVDKIIGISDKIEDDMNVLEARRIEAEKDISDIQKFGNAEDSDIQDQMRITEKEYQMKMEKLNERKNLLTALMTQHCDDCDEILREYGIYKEIAQVDKDIADLEENFLKQANENEESLKELDTEKAVELNAKYLELIEIYKKEIEVLKNKDDINVNYQDIIAEWKKYAELNENLHISVRSKIEGVTSDSLDFIKIASIESTTEEKSKVEIIGIEVKVDDEVDNNNNNNISFDKLKPQNYETSQDDGVDEKTNKPLFEWVEFQEYANDLPNDAVLGGMDVDGSPLYVVRVTTRNSQYYGKYAFSSGRKNAYITTPDREMGAMYFDILTAKNYGWCESKAFDYNSKLLPICRVRYQDSLIPGTLLNDGSCRIGFSYYAKIFTNDIEILSFSPCNY